MALFSADFGNWSFHSYVGILSGTNLGAPLTQTIGSAKWVGSWRTGNVYNDLRVSFCEDNVGTHPSCPAPTPTPTEVTAKVWVDSFDEDLAHGVNAADQRSQFLIGKATKLDSGGIRPWSSDPTRRGTLNLATATFNGVALGGDRADGMALFSADFGNWSFHSYVGILSGTNLGAPLTQTIGSAKWVGSWRTGNVYNDLRVSFCEDNVGTHPSCPAPTPTPTEVTAKVWVDSFDEDLAHGVNAADQRSQFLIGKATKLDSGGIRPWSSDPTRRGTLNLATATFNGVALGGDRADGMALFSADFGNWSFHSYVGILSGTNLGAPLTQTIGSPKWVGSWRTGNVYNDLRVSFCEDNVGTHPSCPAPTPQVTAKVWVDSFDEDLAHGVNAADQRSQFLIGKATKLDSGGIRPWSSDPTRRGTLNLATATFNGVALGGDRADGMALFSADFGNWSFHSYVGILSGTNLGAPLTQTIGSAKWVGSWRTGNVYNDLRVSFCEDKVGTHPECPAPTPQVTAEVWADSFDEDLAHGVNAADQRSQFLIGKATKLDSGGIRPWSSDPTRRGTLNLATATFNGVALGGDRADGMALFSADFGNWSFHSYVGILSGTNLGAPLTQTIGSAKWVGSWRTGNVYNDLRVSFVRIMWAPIPPVLRQPHR